MSHFYADIGGNRGMATRQGTKKSGIAGHIRGWNIGAEVFCFYNDETEKDTVNVYLTGGSNRRSSSVFLGSFTEEDLK